MSYTPTPTDILAIRYEIQDTSVGLYILDDATISYYLTKHSGSITQTALDCAKAMLFKLSSNASDEQVDIFSIKGSKASQEFREALKLYIKDPSLNRLYITVQPYIGNTSKSDIALNNSALDNQFVQSLYSVSLPDPNSNQTDFFSN